MTIGYGDESGVCWMNDCTSPTTLKGNEWNVFKSGCSPFSFSLPIENFGFLSQPKKTKKQNLKLNILGTTDYTLFHGSLGGLPRDYSEDYA